MHSQSQEYEIFLNKSAQYVCIVNNCKNNKTFNHEEIKIKSGNAIWCTITSVELLRKRE